MGCVIEDLLERFVRYVQIDTQSDIESSTCPSTETQWSLLRLLEQELQTLGARDVHITPFGYVLATIPSTLTYSVPVVAFFAHVDTADACPGKAKPIVHRNFDGKPIVLPDDPSQIIEIVGKEGETIITASGKTLLGADDKAGVAIIMAMARHLLLHPEIPHGEIRICFNPDEEIGRGMHKLDLSQLNADFAYTLDSEDLGEINGETFSADAALIHIKGVAAHPGSAKGVLVNALKLASHFISLLPDSLSPEHTCDRQGFIHPVSCVGSAEEATIRLILRDFELEGLSSQKTLLETLIHTLAQKEPRAHWQLEVTPQYRNMRYWLDKNPLPITYAKEAYKRAGLTPILSSVRGGTDGSYLTEHGLLTPNLFTGFHNIHSPREWVSLHDMHRSMIALVHLVQVWAEHGKGV